MKLHNFSTEYIDKNLESGIVDQENALLFNCTLNKLNNTKLIKCDLNRSKILTTKIKDILDFSITLNCKTFNNVELSELVFDLLLVLLTKTKGNDSKREQLIQVIGKERVKEILKEMETIE